MLGQENFIRLVKPGFKCGKHKDSFISQLYEREKILKAQFEAIDSLDYRPSFEYSRTVSEDFFESIG